MRVRMLTVAAGPNGVWMPGSVVELPPATAALWVAGGYAEAVEPLPPPAPLPNVATAALPVPETPERRRPAKRRT